MEKWDIDSALQAFKRLDLTAYQPDDLSESDTRSKLIDQLLIGCLGWSEKNIIREQGCAESGTFLDYKISTNIPMMIIEAKRASIDFQLPSSSSQREYKIGGVLSSCKVLLKAMTQARDYAMSKGVTFCMVTNGKQYIFFRAVNQQGIEWTEHRVILFRSLDDIADNFDHFCRLLSRSSVESGSLQREIRVSADSDTDENKFKTLDTRHLTNPRKIDRNPLFPYIGEVVRRTFQDLASDHAESEILEHCYVESPKKPDKKQPYLDRDTNDLVVSKKNAGDFQQRITSSLQANKLDHSEVILLLGSVGVGKSTFIQRFRKVLAKSEIDNKGIWIYLNFKHFSGTGEDLNSFIFNQIEETLSNDYGNLQLSDWSFLKQAYHPEYEKLKRGPLSPLYEKSPEEFELQFGLKVNEWMDSDREKHYTKILSTIKKQLNKSIFLVFDNADQLSPDTQNQIFLASQKLSETVNCYALLAMREESYWKNRDSGPLNAFHTTAYHVQPATLRQVISKRFNYAKSLIRENRLEVVSDFEISNEELIRVFDRLVQTLLGENEEYINFVESTSARDTRRALDTIAAFMISGHTNIEAILRDERRLSPTGFPIPFHEFLNSIILRDHESYSESSCDTLNLFNTSGGADISNFNRIAVLGRVLNSKNSKTAVGNGYILIEDVISDCHASGILPETTIGILSTLNSRRLIETETTIKDDISSSRYVRATISGSYYIENLSQLFGYLELILYETPIGNEKSFKKMNNIHKAIARVTKGTNEARLKRVELRLDLTQEFIEYLYFEFQKCSFKGQSEKFSHESRMLLSTIKEKFKAERVLVLERARKIFGK